MWQRAGSHSACIWKPELLSTCLTFLSVFKQVDRVYLRCSYLNSEPSFHVCVCVFHCSGMKTRGHFANAVQSCSQSSVIKFYLIQILVLCCLPIWAQLLVTYEHLSYTLSLALLGLLSYWMRRWKGSNLSEKSDVPPALLFSAMYFTSRGWGICSL